MKRLSAVLLTIALHSLLLLVCSGWLLGQLQLTIAWVSLPKVDLSVRIDHTGWLLQRSPGGPLWAVYRERLGITSIAYDDVSRRTLEWEQAFRDEDLVRPLPGVVCFARADVTGAWHTAILAIHHWLPVSLIWIIWLIWNRRTVVKPFSTTRQN